MARVEVEVSRFNLPGYRRRRRPLREDEKNNISRFGPELGPILDWLDENCTEVYIGRFKEDVKITANQKVEFEFTNVTDAMAFKLMFS